MQWEITLKRLGEQQKGEGNCVFRLTNLITYLGEKDVLICWVLNT